MTTITSPQTGHNSQFAGTWAADLGKAIVSAVAIMVAVVALAASVASLATGGSLSLNQLHTSLSSATSLEIDSTSALLFPAESNLKGPLTLSSTAAVASPDARTTLTHVAWNSSPTQLEGPLVQAADGTITRTI